MTYRQCEGSKCGRILQSNEHGPRYVTHLLALLLAKIANERLFPVIWPTDKCEGSKWSRILPGIQWAWSQTCNTSHCPLIGRNSQWLGTGLYMYQVIHIHDEMSHWFKELFLRKSLIRKGFKKSNILDLYVDLVKSSNKRDIIRIDNNGTSAIGKKLLKKITGFSHRNIY